MAVRIVTDSSAGLPEEVVEELDITVIDLHVMDDGEQRSTSGLSSLELAAAYARQLERGGDEGVVALHLSKELSSTWSAAISAAAVFADGAVRVIDTGNVGMAMGAAAMAAASLAADGAGIDECAEIAENTLARAETWIYLHRIDDMAKSGRISATTTVVSTVLATKPIMRVNDGKIELAAKTRTQTKAFAKLVDIIAARAGGEPAFVAIQHNEAKEAARTLEDMLHEVLAEGSSLMITPLEKTLAVHCGAGAIGISAVFSDVENPEESDEDEQ